MGISSHACEVENFAVYSAIGRADSNVTVKVTKPGASAKPTFDSPEVVRLKTVLAAMTTPPPAEIARTATKDSMVSPTSGPKP